MDSIARDGTDSMISTFCLSFMFGYCTVGGAVGRTAGCSSGSTVDCDRLFVDTPGHYTVRMTVVLYNEDAKRGDGVVLGLEDLLEASSAGCCGLLHNHCHVVFVSFSTFFHNHYSYRGTFSF